MKKEISHELYTQLKDALNENQKKLLFEVYNNCEVENFERGFKEGERQGLKTAIKLIIEASSQ